jgi:hypothetical protein
MSALSRQISSSLLPLCIFRERVSIQLQEKPPRRRERSIAKKVIGEYTASTRYLDLDSEDLPQLFLRNRVQGASRRGSF